MFTVNTYAPKLSGYLFLTASVPTAEVDWNNIGCFDKDGFDLCELERVLYTLNRLVPKYALNRWAYQHTWFVQESNSDNNYGVRLDHSFLMARYGYASALKEQIKGLAYHKPMLNKLLQIKPKWGIDINIEYIMEDGYVLDVFHIEEDFFSYREYSATKSKIEEFVTATDWELVAHDLYKKKCEWEQLTGDDENDYKARFVGFDRAYKTRKVL